MTTDINFYKPFFVLFSQNEPFCDKHRLLRYDIFHANIMTFQHSALSVVVTMCYSLLTEVNWRKKNNSTFRSQYLLLKS